MNKGKKKYRTRDSQERCFQYWMVNRPPWVSLEVPASNWHLHSPWSPAHPPVKGQPDQTHLQGGPPEHPQDTASRPHDKAAIPQPRPPRRPEQSARQPQQLKMDTYLNELSKVGRILNKCFEKSNQK